MNKTQFKPFYPSLFTLIYILFFVSLCCMVFVLYYSNKIILEAKQDKVLTQTFSLAQQSMFELMGADTARIDSLLSQTGFSPIKQIPPKAKIFQNLDNIKIFQERQYYGFAIEYLGNHYIAKKDFSQELSLNLSVNLWIILNFLILSVAFTILLATLHPIKILHFGLKELIKGNYNVKIPIPKEPRWALLAQTFNQVTQKIAKLLHTRKLVLRNIGHELKTPIAKAKLALELLPPNPQKESLKASIESLNLLTDKILTFEKIQEGDELLTKETFGVERLVLEALSSMLIAQEEVKLDLKEHFNIFGDLTFLSIALKNLIENAKKYKTQGQIEIFTTKEKEGFCLSVKNFGDKLERKIEDYFEAFIRDKKHELISGYGLGLGIVQGILELHKFPLIYSYAQNQHCFKIIFKED